MQTADKRMRAKALNPLGYIGTSGSAPGVKEAQAIMANLNRTMAQEALRSRRDLARGIINEDEFHRRALVAGGKFRQGINTSLNKLDTLGPIGQAALEQQWNNAGGRASKAFGTSFLLGKQALSTQGGAQAEVFLRSLTTKFNEKAAQTKAALTQGLIDPREFKRRGDQAAAEFNRSLITGTQKLKAQGILGKDVETAMIAQFKTAGARAGNAMAQEAQRVFRESQSKLQAIGQSFSSAGRAMTIGMTLPIVGIGAAILKTSAEFERSMNTVQARTRASTHEFIQLQEAARQFGQSEFGATKVSAGMAQLALAGLKTNEIIGVMPDMMAMATAGMVDLSRAAEITTQILRSQAMGIENMGRVADVLVKGSISAQTDLNDLAISFKYVGAIGNAAGQNFEQITAALLALSNAGFTASFAGTNMRQAMIKLLDPSFRASKIMADLELKVEDAAGAMLPFSEIVRQLEERGLSAGDAMRVFGARAGPGMASLMNLGSATLRDFEAKLKGAGNTAQTVRETQLRGLTGEMAKLKGAIQELAIAVGSSGLLSALTQLAIRFTLFISELSRTNPALFTLALSMGIVLATLGPMTFAIGKMVIGYRLLRVAMNAAGLASKGLAAMLMPAGILGVALIAVTFILWRYIEASRKAAEETAKFRESISQLTTESLRSLSVSLEQDIRQLEQYHATLQPKKMAPGGLMGGLEVPTKKMREVAAAIEDTRAKLVQIRAQITENNAATEEQRKMYADLTAVLYENQLAMDAATAHLHEGRGGGGESPAETFLNLVQRTIERMELMRELGQDITKQTKLVSDLQALAATHIEAGGGHMEASLEYLRAMQLILDALDKDQEDSFAKQAQRIAKIMAIKVDLALGDYHAILDSLLELQGRIRDAAAAQGLSIEEQYRLAQAARTVRDAIEEVIDKITDTEIPFSHTMNIWEAQRQKQEKAFGEAFNDLIFRAYDVAREFTSVRSVVRSAALQVGEGLVEAFESIPTPADVVVGALHVLWTSLKIVTGGIGAVIGSLRDFAMALSPGAMLGVLSDGLHQIVGSISSALSPINFFGQVFSQIAQALAPTFDVLAPTMAKFAAIMANTINPILEELMPIIEALFPVIQAILRVLAPIIKALLPLFAALVPILEALFPVFKMLAIAATYVAEIFLRVSAVILDVVGFFVKGVGEAIIGIGKLIDLIPGISGKAIINAGKSVRGVGDSLRKAADGARASAKAMARAREEIRNVEIGDALTEVANQFRKFADLNVPEIFKIKLEEFRAIQPDPASAFPRGWIAPSVTPSGVSGAAVVDNSVTFGPSSIIIHGTDKSVAQIYEESLAEARRLQQNRTGSTAGTRLF